MMNPRVSNTSEFAAVSAADIPVTRGRSRVAAIAVLGITAGLVGLLARSVYFMATDSWVAPIHLSRDNDAVLQLEMKLSREQAEMARVEADVHRIDGDLGAVEAGLARLGELRDSSGAPLAWQAQAHGDEQKTLGRVLASLQEEVRLLERLNQRQIELTAAARHDLEAGLIERRELQRHEQELDGFAVALAEKRRMIEEARHEERVATSRSSAYRAGLDAPNSRGADGVMPEVAASKEHAARVEIELMRLEAERRNLVGLKQVAEQTLARQKELLGELQARPLYRAMHKSTDVAFVPYDQLEQVRPGARVMACTWGLVLCKEVGAVSEILAGEVATQDPWGEMARGQYAILELADPDAIREKVLRIRL